MISRGLKPSSFRGKKTLRGGVRRIHTKPRKRRKSSPLALAKKALWKVTRLLVFKTYGSDCYTCSQKNLKGSNRHGGHMPWASSELSITCRFDIRYIRAQCYDCNVNKNGRGVVAEWKMKGEGINVKDLWRHNQETKGIPRDIEWIKDLTAHYQFLLEIH